MHHTARTGGVSCLTVVSGGIVWLAIGRSSNPTIRTASGTAIPRSRKVVRHSAASVCRGEDSVDPPVGHGKVAGDFLTGAIGRKVRGHCEDFRAHSLGHIFGPGKAGGEFDWCVVTYERDPARTGSDQPFRRHPAAESVIGADDAVPLAFLMIAPNHHRQIAISHVLDSCEPIGFISTIHISERRDFYVMCACPIICNARSR